MDDDAAWDRAARANAEHRPVVILDGVVQRPAGAQTATVHALLRHLRDRGLDTVPEALGIEGSVERLAVIEGEDGGRSWYHQHTDEGLVSAARLLRTVHDASADWAPPADAVWLSPPVPARAGEDLVICHGDPGPWNMVWRSRQAVGLIDWDYAHPAPRLHDVAYALRWFVPMRSDEHASAWHHFPAVPDRRGRIATFLAAYGDDALPSFDVVDAVTSRMQETSDLEAALAAAGVEPQRTWVADGSLQRHAAEIGWVHEHRAELT